MDTKTHSYITEKSINIAGLNNKVSENIRNEIIHYSTQPDFDETTCAFKYHFYNPATGKNFNDEYKSALTMFCDYYKKAEKNYMQGERFSEYLGRAIHYLVDINTPVHTYNQDVFDAVVNVSSHVYFENKCDELIEKIRDDELPNNINDDYFNLNSITTIANNCALKSSVLFDMYSKIKSKKDVEPICIQAVMNAIKNTSGIIKRFFGGAVLWE